MKSDNMTRISLKEAYDNKDVIAQIYAIRDTAESAVDTSEQAVTTANTASEHVDVLVPQVEQAVENANQASTSAQQSAQTVAGYENRLGTVEGDVVQLNRDVDGVTLRVTTAEGNIVTIQGRVTALETADGQNVKLSGTQNITGIKTAPLEMTGVISNQIATSQKVMNELDNYQPMMRLANSQTYTGTKELLKSANILVPMIRITDVTSENYPDLIYLSGIRDGNNNWLVNDRVGSDNEGARGYYQKQYRLHTNTGNYTVNVRLNLTSTGVQIQVLDPINNQWRTVQLS